LKDCYAAGRSAPVSDLQQDYILLDGAEIEGYTILKFKRKLNTCDDINDKEIKIGTQYMIFAWNNVDPLTGNNDWKYHGSTNRVSRTIMLLTFKDESLDQQTNLPTDTFTHSMRVPNVSNGIFLFK
jgi:hypothetical protein